MRLMLQNSLPPQPPQRSARRRLYGLAIALVTLSLSTCSRPMPAPHAYLAFVACKGTSTVAVVNLEKLQTIRSISVAARPIQVCARPRHRELEILSSNGTVSQIDFPSLNVVRTTRTGTSASQFQFSRHGRRAYVLNAESGKVAVLNASQGVILRQIALGRGIRHFTLTPNGKILIASDSISNQVIFADPGTGKILGRVEVGKDPGHLAVLPDGSKVFVADAGENKVSVVDVASRQLLSNIDLGAPPSLMALKPDGGELFVFADRSATLSIIDTTADNIEQSYPTSDDVSGAVFTPDSKQLYILSGGRRVIFFDAANRSTLAAIPIGSLPDTAALTPDGRFLVVGGGNSGMLVVLRTAPPGLITQIPVGEHPVDAAIPGWTAPNP